MQQIYVSEPQAIDITAAQDIVGSGYRLTAGSPDFKAAAADTAILLMRSATTVGPSIRQHFPKLQHVIRVGTGLDTIDMAYCQQAGIAVYNAPGANAEAVSEYVLSVILLALRRLHMLDEAAIRGWDRFKFMGHGLAGRTVGIVGYGNIGRRLHRKLAAFEDMRFLAYDPYLQPSDVAGLGVELTDLNHLLRSASIISLHLPLTQETHHLLDAAALAKLPHGAILVNAARGGIVDETAALAAAQAQALTYIADAVENEPHVNPALLGQDNLIITPHIASLTTDSDQAMLRLALQNFLDGRAVKLAQ